MGEMTARRPDGRQDILLLPGCKNPIGARSMRRQFSARWRGQLE
jgi:hypothetical protein